MMAVVLMKKQNDDDGVGGGIKFDCGSSGPLGLLLWRGDKPSLTNWAGGGGDPVRTKSTKVRGGAGCGGALKR